MPLASKLLSSRYYIFIYEMEEVLNNFKYTAHSIVKNILVLKLYTPEIKYEKYILL